MHADEDDSVVIPSSRELFRKILLFYSSTQTFLDTRDAASETPTTSSERSLDE